MTRNLLFSHRAGGQTSATTLRCYHPTIVDCKLYSDQGVVRSRRAHVPVFEYIGRDLHSEVIVSYLTGFFVHRVDLDKFSRSNLFEEIRGACGVGHSPLEYCLNHFPFGPRLSHPQNIDEEYSEDRSGFLKEELGLCS